MVLGFFFEGSLISCTVILVASLGSCYNFTQPLFLLCIWKYTSVSSIVAHNVNICWWFGVQTFAGRWTNLSLKPDNNSKRSKALNGRLINSVSTSPDQSYYVVFENLSVDYVGIDGQYVKCCIFVHSMMTRLCIWICIINHIEVFNSFNKCIWW